MAKSFYAKDWRGSRWITYEFNEIPWVFGHFPGVYVVYGDGVLVYVGQSGSVSKRICTHRIVYSYGSSILTPWGQFKTVRVKVRYSTKFGDWAMREIRLIWRLKPIGNRFGKLFYGGA